MTSTIHPTTPTGDWDINLADAATRHYWFQDGEHGQSVIAPSGMSADAVLAECIARTDYDTPDNATYHITFKLWNYRYDEHLGEWIHGGMIITHKTVAYHPDEPSCADTEYPLDHEWEEAGPYRQGGGTHYVAGCHKCDWQRDSYHHCYSHGADQFQTGVVYQQVA